VQVWQERQNGRQAVAGNGAGGSSQTGTAPARQQQAVKTRGRRRYPGENAGRTQGGNGASRTSGVREKRVRRRRCRQAGNLVAAVLGTECWRRARA